MILNQIALSAGLSIGTRIPAGDFATFGMNIVLLSKAAAGILTQSTEKSTRLETAAILVA